jgi:hypothetical protein
VRSKKLPENWQELQEKIKNVFVFLETELQKRGSLFFNGKRVKRLEIVEAEAVEMNSTVVA